MDTQSDPIEPIKPVEPVEVRIDGSVAPAPIPSSVGSNLAIPAAIVVAGALVAFAVYQRGATTLPVPSRPSQAAVVGAFKQISENDHIRGNPNAPVKIIEYSDTECPFCKRFHPTLKQVIDEYGRDGRVAWVYRHLPLESLHSKAVKESEALECASKIGGQEKFWAYLDRIFEITPSNNGLDPALLGSIAADVGVDRASFEKCLSSGEFTQFVKDSIIDATNAGAQGTPYSIVVSKSGKKYPINGALPYESVKQAIDLALSDK